MASRLTLRGTTFNIPSNRLLWLSLGKYDSLVEYQEVASRLMLAAYNPSKETFREYLIKVSKTTGVYLNDITLQNFKQIQYQGYLIYPNASFDEFLSGFKEDVRVLIDDNFAESNISGCRFDKIWNALVNIGVVPTIDSAKIDLYHYYRLLRNDLAHRLNNDYKTEYASIDLNAIKGFYPTKALPQPKASLNFDDFILCTANVKNIADEMTRSLLPHIDWTRIGIANKDKWFPKYKRLITENRKDRLHSYIRTSVHSLYGIQLPEHDIEQLIGSLE